MDMKERLQELAEAAGKRISESEGLFFQTFGSVPW